jgi:hypothetical protein
MSSDHQPFFTPDELRSISIFRPSKWRDLCRSEPASTWLLVAIIVLATLFGIYETYWGDPAVGKSLVIVSAAVVGVIGLLAPVASVVIACVRYPLRKTRIAIGWKRVEDTVIRTVKAIFWTGLVLLMLTQFGPYVPLALSHPSIAWRAFQRNIPPDRVTLAKRPHDCDFDTAPLGNKNCHYDTKIITLSSAETADAKPGLFVEYEKVDD